MKNKYLYHAFGIMVFLVGLVTYLLTVQPTVPFWDCGEFSASSVWQQVPHPPGAPLFLIMAKVFHILIPFGGDGWQVNLISVFASAFTVWLLYLITVKVIFNFRDKPVESLAEELAIYGSAFVGSIALVFSDTFWFNAVESEVYASSSLFVAIVAYLMMRWNEEADNPGNERYILLIAYLMGLSMGVHLLSILTIFSIVLLVYFKKYSINYKSINIMGAIALVIFFSVYVGFIKWLPSLIDGTLPFKNECRELIFERTPILMIITIFFIILTSWGLWYGYKKKFSMLNLICSSILLMILGYSTYTQILVRSNSNSPMNENEPKNFHLLTSYLGREQYGEAPNWPRRYQTEGYFIDKYNKTYSNGDSVYGTWIEPDYTRYDCKDGERAVTLPEFKNTNFSGEMKFFFKYQIYHMYLRYFLWNYVGRNSDVQDADYAFVSKKQAKIDNYKSGYASIYPIRFYALPLLLGLFGLIFHFWKDPKMSTVFFIMFLLMGVLAAIAQNQQEPQPRERDYFYAGSFFVFCMWISLGTYGLIEWLIKKLAPMPVMLIIILATLLVPVNMAVGGWKMHSRAGNYLPFDYSYNILQSVEKDAIIFTNGDNDTFPLWYLQDVAGVRRDVRIVNLSLGNTLWYIDQLKNRSPWGAKPIPLSFPNESLQVDENNQEALSYDFGEGLNVEIPVPLEVMKKYTNDPALLNDPVMRFTTFGDGKPRVRRNPRTNSVQDTMYLFRVQDKLVIDILKQTKFTRPVYYSTSVGSDAQCQLDKYFRNEGMAQRICPVPQRVGSVEIADEQIMDKCLLNIDNSTKFYQNQHFGLKFRNLNNPGVFYDEVHRRLMYNYRAIYITYAIYCQTELKKPQKCAAVLDTLNNNISPVQFPMSYDQEYRMARIYDQSGAKNQAKKFALMGIKSCEEIIGNTELMPDVKYYEIVGRYYGPYRVSSMLHEMIGDYASAREKLQKLYSQIQATFEGVQYSQANKDDVMKLRYSMYEILTAIDDLSLKELINQGKDTEALNLAKSLLKKYSESSNPDEKYMSYYMQQRVQELEGNPDSNAQGLRREVIPY